MLATGFSKENEENKKKKVVARVADFPDFDM